MNIFRSSFILVDNCSKIGRGNIPDTANRGSLYAVAQFLGYRLLRAGAGKTFASFIYLFRIYSPVERDCSEHADPPGVSTTLLRAPIESLIGSLAPRRSVTQTWKIQFRPTDILHARANSRTTSCLHLANLQR